MQHPALSCVSSLLLVLAVTPARSADDPRAIVARAVEALGGETNLSRAKAFEAKIKGTFHDPGVKESLVEGAKFTGELITQLPSQVKQSVLVDTAAGRLLETRVLNGHRSWTRDNEQVQQDDQASLTDFEQSAYVDYVSSLVPLFKDKGYSLSFVGEVQVNGQAAIAIKVTSQGHPDVMLYFDKGSGFLLKNDYRRRDPATKKVVLHEELFSDYREVDPTETEQRTLNAAQVGSEDSAVLDFLRKQTLSDEARKTLKDLIRGLGDTSFQARQKAKADLVARGSIAIPLLTQALKDPDPEVAGLAKECLQAIGKRRDSAAVLAAVRLLALRKPAGAAEVLLGYLPSAPDEATAREVRAALAAVAFRDGKPDQALVHALKDKDPERQALAAALVGKGGESAREMPGQRLLLPGLKRATKIMAKDDGRKSVEYELSDIQIFNKLDDSVFSPP